MYKNIDPDYYGYRDEDDGVLVKVEAEAQAKAVGKAVEEWKQEKKRQRTELEASGSQHTVDDSAGDDHIDVSILIFFV